MKNLLGMLALATAGAIGTFCLENATKPEYIIHWTSDEPCHECNTRTAVFCTDNRPDCNVPRKIVSHFEICATKELALKTANELGGPVPDNYPWSAPASMWLTDSTPPKHGTVVAIYEANKLPIKITSKEIAIPQPAKTETVTTVELGEK